jgi:hypothetical protein
VKALDPPGAPERMWQCDYCHAVGTFEELEALECSYVYPPCEHCGQTPTCAQDCPGVLGLLGQHTVVAATATEICARCGLGRECRDVLGDGTALCFSCATSEEKEAYGRRLFG